MSELTKQILNKYIGKIIVLRPSDTYLDKDGNQRILAKWKKEREKYVLKEYSEDLILWETPQDVIPIEFEGSREQNDEWIKQTQQKCDELGFQYCICDHSGKSKYLWLFNFENLPNEPEKNHQCKKFFVQKVIPEKSIVDYSNLGIGLTPIVDHQHWKKRYNGNIHGIVEGTNPLEHWNKLPEEWKKNAENKWLKNTIESCQEIVKSANIKNILSNYKIQKLLKTPVSVGQRSEQEQSLVNLLVFKGVLDFDTVNKIMLTSMTGKWKESPESYRKLTYNKALEFFQKKQQEKNCNQLDTENKVKTILSKPKREYKSLGCGIHNDTFYFGTTLEDGNYKYDAIITSDKKIYVCWNKEKNQIKNNFGLNYRFPFFDDCVDHQWSYHSIRKWLYEDVPKLEIKELFQIIHNINKKLVFHVDERVHIYVACDVLSNYFYQIFDAKGRTYFSADFGSGKTRQSTVYKMLSFNPLFASNISPASFERVIESTSGTLIVDNFDNIADDIKKLILQCVEVYYKKGGKHIKADGQNHRPIAFNGYSPLVINNIIGLPEVTESRCNKILMLKSNDKNIVDVPINEKDKRFTEIRDGLHICALQNWEYVQDIYENLQVPELTARDLEKVEAVLTIAKCVSEETYNSLLKYIVETNSQQNIRELSDNWVFVIYKYLNEKVETELTIPSKEIADGIYNELFDSSDIKNEKKNMTLLTRYIGKVLSNTNLLGKTVYRDGIVHYKIKRKDLDKLIEVKGFVRYLKPDTLNTLNTPNTPNTLDTLNNNKKTNTLNFEENKAKTSGQSVSSVLSGSKTCGQVLEFIKKNDTGIGVRTDSILTECEVKTPAEEDQVLKLLDRLKERGELFNPRPDLWKVM